MKEENKIYLIEIQKRIARRTGDPDPEGAFDAAWYLWKQYCIRHGVHKRQFFSQQLKKGWLRRFDADHFWWCMFGENHY